MRTRLSISSIKLFKACRRAYELRNIYKVVPVEISGALQTGLGYHSLIEQLHSTGELPELNSKEAAMATAYARYILPDMPEFEPEVWFEKRVERGKILVGRLDGKAKDAIIEHKTTSATSIDEYEEGLQWDEQLMAYFLATGCNEAFYTVCRKPTLRQKVSETNEEYAERCLEWYETDTFEKIRLLKVSRTDEEISAYKQELSRIFKDIRTAERNSDFYRNTCNCNAWGRRCEYAPICLHYDPDETYIGFTNKREQGGI